MAEESGYYYGHGHGENKSEKCLGFCLYGLSMAFIIIFFPFTIWFCITIIKEYQRIIILRNGKLLKKKVRGPGVIFLIPCIDEYQKVDLRTESIDVPSQEALTRDSATVEVDAVVYYRIFDPLMAVMAVSDYRYSTRLLAMTTFRNVLGQKDLAEILSDRISISLELLTILDEATDPWGIKVERVEIKDVCLPRELQRAMAAEAEASRGAKAKIIAAEGELNASKSLKLASDVMASSPTAVTLRYLQTLNTIATEKNSTIIFPLPMDLLGTFMQSNR